MAAEENVSVGALELSMEEARSGTSSAGNVTSPRWTTGLADLPDLEDRIDSTGLYEEYQLIRQSHLPSLESTNHFRSWFPTFQAWTWRRTVSFWISVAFMEGSLLFTFASFCLCFTERLSAIIVPLTAWPALFGGVFFSLGGYLMCLETMNAKTESAQWQLWPFSAKLIFDLGNDPDGTNLELRLPYLTSLSYFLGTCIYPIGLISALFDDLSPNQTLWLSTIPFTVGGILFMIGGFIECHVCKVFAGWPKELTWFGAVCSLIGGVCFFFGSFVLFWPNTHLTSSIIFFVGSFAYVVGSSLCIVMWKDEQYGLTFLYAMNEFVRSGYATPRADATPHKFTWRSIMFIHWYCVVSVVSIVNFCLGFHSYLKSAAWLLATGVFNELLPFVLMHLVLLVSSAVVKTPKLQPYRALVLVLRGLACYVGLDVFLSFYAWGIWRHSSAGLRCHTL